MKKRQSGQRVEIIIVMDSIRRKKSGIGCISNSTDALTDLNDVRCKELIALNLRWIMIGGDKSLGKVTLFTPYRIRN